MKILTGWSKSHKVSWSFCQDPWWSSWSLRHGRRARKPAPRWSKRTYSPRKASSRSAARARTPPVCPRTSGPCKPKACSDPMKKTQILQLGRSKMIHRLDWRKSTNGEWRRKKEPWKEKPLLLPSWGSEVWSWRVIRLWGRMSSYLVRVFQWSKQREV